MRLILFVFILVLFFAIATKPITINYESASKNTSKNTSKKTSKKRRVVCSLTTRPVQPHYFKKVLDNLVAQFDAVYLALPRISCKGVVYPRISHPGVTVVMVEKDLGPITKFFGILNSDEPPNTLVVVLDDDVIYDANLRENYERNHTRYPNSVISGAGMVYKYPQLELPWFLSMTGRRENYTHFLPSFLGSKHLTTVCGYTGICFRRRLINKKDLLNFIHYWNMNRECFVNDDIVISAFFASRDIPRLWVSTPRCRSESSKDVESLSDKGQIGMFFSQDKAYTKLRDCFRNDPVRFDCVCGLDLLIIALGIYSQQRSPRV